MAVTSGNWDSSISVMPLELGADGAGIGLGEDGADGGGHHLGVGRGHLGQGVAMLLCQAAMAISFIGGWWSRL